MSAVDVATCLSFESASGWTELIRGRRLAGVEAAVCSPDHAVFARFNGRSTEAWHSIANGPHRSGALHSRHFDVVPAAHRLTNWDAGIDRLEYLAVFLPRDVVDRHGAVPGGEVSLRPGLG